MRVLRPLLIALVVLGVLFVAADRIAVAVAESEAADHFRQAQPVEGDPEISIDGFPFLTQLLGGKLDEVHASARGMRAQDQGTSVRIDRFKADLHDVKFSNGFTTATAETLTGTVLITYADLTAAAPDGVTVSYGGSGSEPGTGEVKVIGRLSLLGRTWQKSVTSEVRLVDGGTVKLRARSIPGADQIPGLEGLVRERIDFSKKITGLPSGIELQKLEAGPDGVTIKLAGKGVSLSG
ncbi:LmeA family phospholipid-binding protein [Wenjunlia tyrosinilytica]|uniref:DUF2993 domain-containing protein n=1 Tax=Wenjunlia tyrosinilytica TaxID=1544741 RepID=A0A917ZNZ8_9ACTN|nr:DUF2993 domain-containing protein [Wenjunlia tyrosinilytica]GGO87291.1 hypothetical protein GCM10012280_25440 [Wenjunlia tyrosinilytica]